MFQTGQPLHEKGFSFFIYLCIYECSQSAYHSSYCVLLQHGQQLYRHIYLGCKEESSGRRHYEALFALLGLLSMELANEEVVVDLIRLALALQVADTFNTSNL